MVSPPCTCVLFSISKEIIMNLITSYIPLGAVTASIILLSTLPVQAHNDNGNSKSQSSASAYEKQNANRSGYRSCGQTLGSSLKTKLRLKALRHCSSKHHRVGRSRSQPIAIKTIRYIFLGCRISRSQPNGRRTPKTLTRITSGRITFSCR